MKFGVAVLGRYGRPEDRELFRTLGRHEEFTLFCGVALANGEDGERELWDLARAVDGWGRIHCVERLAGTNDPEIKDWLLREGYRNSVMFEYTAHACAEGGGLLEALTRDDVGDGLLDAAGELLSALIAGGPAADMDDYPDGAAAAAAYLGHMEGRARSLRDFLAVDAVRRFLADEDADWPDRVVRGWTPEVRADLLARCSAILGRPEWRGRVAADLGSTDEVAFRNATRAAKSLGIDVRDVHWDRLRASPLDAGRWYHVMSGCDAGRIGEAVALAERTLPLGRIATGPGTDLGLGPGYEPHGCLDFILQDLGRFPGRGPGLVEAGLASPVVRNRNYALRVLAAWGRDAWPPGMTARLETAFAREPDADVRRRIGNLLAGRPLDEGDDGADDG